LILSLVLKLVRFEGLIWDPANPVLEPGRVEEKTREEKTRRPG
jgi:hypothetical protein